MRILLICLTFVAGALEWGLGMADVSALQSPSIAQADPGLDSLCTNAQKGTTVATATSTDQAAQLIYGRATFTGWNCTLKIHSGRGPGNRQFSGCASVIWDTAGNIVEVDTLGAIAGKSLPPQCL